MPKLSHRICEPRFGGHHCWYIYDSYYQMLIEQTLPCYKTKSEAEMKCRELNSAYKSMGIQKGDTYRTKPMQARRR